jgi:Na+(H+)/acetate symporter ActP
MTIRRTPSEDNKICVIYFLVVWGMPGLFLLIFGLLDHYGVFIVDYGKSVVCWLGTKESTIFLFILPFGILLLFNLIMFIIVALRLRENQKSSAKALGMEAKKRQTQNIKVCLKLSTLMGFSWLFGLLQVAVETETDAFEYLFIIFVSFQGLFICAAFLFQRKCYELYNTLIFSSSRGTSTGAKTPSKSRRVKDTKL